MRAKLQKSSLFTVFYLHILHHANNHLTINLLQNKYNPSNVPYSYIFHLTLHLFSCNNIPEVILLMDKKLIEKYLKNYPHIDEEIKRIESDIDYLEKKKADYEHSPVFSKYPDILKTVNEGLIEMHELFSEAICAKQLIAEALGKMDYKQKRIIELRFWNGCYFSTRWSEIGTELRLHKKTAERIYRETIKTLLI